MSVINQDESAAIRRDDRKIESSADQLEKYKLIVKRTIEAIKEQEKIAKR
jgi:hypothetical protein